MCSFVTILMTGEVVTLRDYVIHCDIFKVLRKASRSILDLKCVRGLGVYQTCEKGSGN